MADFERAFAKTSAVEGGYSNHPSDRGGETYRGISRRRWPLWPGWSRIDEVKKEPGFPQTVQYLQLEEDVKRLYKLHFWDMLHGDNNPVQHVAEVLFDFGVNAGVATSVRYLQECLNVMNRMGNRWPDIKVDGQMGPVTMQAIAACCLRYKYEDVLIKMFGGRMLNHYYAIMVNDPTQEEFAIGWIRRAP